MTGAVALPQWVVIVLLAAAGLAIFLGAYTPRYRKATKAAQAEYVDALKTRNEQLEIENRSQRDRLSRLEAKTDFMKDLLLGKCPACEIDDATGGCRYCTRHLLYGQQPG